MRCAVFASVFLAGCSSGGPSGPAMPSNDENRAPDIASFPTTADHDLAYDITLEVSDPDGDPVTVTARGLPGWLSFDSARRRLTGTPGEAAIGTSATITLTAFDGAVSSRRTATIEVHLGRSNLVAGGPWLQQTPHNLLHDGNPVETARFRVYSGFASPASRQALAALLEARLDDLAGRLGADPATFEFPPDGRLHVFADKLQADGALGAPSTVNGWAFRDGFIVMSDEAPRYGRLGYTPTRWEGLVTHELMHDLEFLLIGRNRSIGSTDAWFREGIATYMSGLAPGGIPVTSVTRQTVAQWRAAMSTVPGGGNPIGIHTFSDFPSQVTQTDTYYLWFAQAIRYLVEDDGFGLGEVGLRTLYDDVRAGLDFATSFEARTGVSLAVFEAEFWDRMEAFLP